MTSTAAQLKAEGNDFFVKKDFVRAHERYTEAIAIDGQNAVLYANRSACSFGMGRYVDALRDAHQATVVDPGYAKGWSRLATAHDAALEYQSAVGAWQKALDALPKANLTPAELKQKEQYTASLEKSKQRLEAVSSGPLPVIVTSLDTEKPPWRIAEEMLPELEAAGQASYSSSAYVIHFANQEWSEGIRRMKTLKGVPIQGFPDRCVVFGHTESLACITNGIMRDMRVVHFDCQDWIDMCNTQLCFEAEKHGAWTSESLESIQQKALERLKKEGWDAVRPALSVVARGWIMRAVLDSELRQASHVAVERLKETLQLLHWGRQVWRDVSKANRGVIFQDTFVRGVKAIYLESLMGAHAQATSADKPAILDTLLQEARELVEDIEKAPHPRSTPNEPIDPGFVSSFYIYPAAQAYATAGYCFVQLGQSSENPMEQKGFYLMAMKQYAQAAEALPEDDEKHCWYLKCTIQPMLCAGVPKDVVMGVVKGIRAVMPKMQRIWAHSALAKQGRDAMIEEALRLAESKWN